MDNGSGISIPLGIFIGLLASFVQSLGLAIQRRSHVLNGQLPEAERKVEHRRPLWIIGFVIFLGSNIFGSFIQIASLPVVILAPLGAVSLLWNALFARLLLRPPLLLGTALIAGGAVLIAVFGIVPEQPRTLDELLALFRRPAFIAWFCVEGVALLVCLVVTHMVEFAYAKRLQAASYLLLDSDGEEELSQSPQDITAPPANQQPSALTTGLSEQIATVESVTERTPLLDPKPAISSSRQPTTMLKQRSPSPSPSSSTDGANPQAVVRGFSSRTPLFLALAYAAASGILSGLCLIFAKSGVELLVLTLKGHNQFYRWETWMLLLGLVVFALGQLWYLNRGLRLSDPAFVCPSAFCFYNFSSILNGLVYFNQLGELPGWHIVLVVLGMLILLAGVWAVSAQAGVNETRVGEEGASDDGEEAIADEEDILEPSPRDAEEQISSVQRLSSASAFSRRSLQPRLLSSTGPPTVHRSSRSLDGTRLENSLSLETIRPSSADSPPPSPSTRADSEVVSPISTTRMSLAGRRRRQTMAVDTSSGGSSYLQSPQAANNSALLSPPLGGGLSIGLSPISPGFSLIHPEQREHHRHSSRRLSGLGLGFSDVVDDAVQERPRTTSEGQMSGHSQRSQRRGEEDGGGNHEQVAQLDARPGMASARWNWLRRAVRRERS
ncbi:hypothetical protein CONPUDRAFT_148788 [Coniophora puteana RWD-64-598 SS2]|uniref:DUF803-domain-containing protein n=1 Tax=Coniophora puteana (strain RWD-64-598) TaxID=741705 RepID=A0A5M3N5Q5_CONPW|nr:uncharacterized protein CONPUDRAFT_148788 [Coniophora puteana RWD-64-598 SS2]EIW86729.1 hypothetical protein CONPUDRAFT_148788 [Coniophora puteana RWD-64-598 SS2]